MQFPIRSVLVVFATIVVACVGVNAQADDFCRGFGLRPSSDEPGSVVPYVYGRIVVKGYDPAGKFPRVSIHLLDARQTQGRLPIDKTGNYCFRRSNSGGILIVEVDGVETARKSIASLGPAQQREDFEVYITQNQPPQAPPGVISTKYIRPRNDKTIELYQKTAEAEAEKDPQRAIKHVTEIVAIDPGDFIAWAKLGSLHFERRSFVDAEAAFRKSIELKPDYTPALLNLGTLVAVRQQFDNAIELFKQAIALEPETARAHRLLGEAYLQIRQGSLGIASLNEAIRLDPQGQAECHLLIARLYDLAGAKNLASREYRLFIQKIPKDRDRKKFEEYIKENPE